MNRYFLSWLIAFSICPCLPAQNLELEVSPSANNPQGQALAAVPEGAIWTVTASKPGRAKGKNAEEAVMASRPVGAEVRQVQSKFYRGVRHVLIERANDERSELYLAADVILLNDTRFNRIRVVEAADVESTAPKPRPGVFYELDWVQPKYYIGNADYQGIACRVYREVSEGSNTATSQMALIDAATKLPVAHDDGQTLWHYEFSEEKALFTLPQEYQQAYRKYFKKLVDITKKYNTPQ